MQTQGSTQSAKPACICPMHYEPVCGSDGKTYGNGCSAKCRGIKVAHRGECKPGDAVKTDTMASETAASSKSGSRCSCAKVYAPVCCKGNKQYGNACEAKCAGAEIESTGECPVQHALTSTTNAPAQHAESAPCKCDPAVKEVCGDDHKTYSNQCMAECAGVKVAGEGACKAAATPKPSKLTASERQLSRQLSGQLDRQTEQVIRAGQTRTKQQRRCSFQW